MQFDLKKFFAVGNKPWHTEFICDLSGYDFSGARIPQPVSAVFDAEYDDGVVRMTLWAKASVYGECARCLDPVERTEEVDAEFLVREQDLSDPDFELPLDEYGRLNLDEWLFQEFLFRVPMVLLCSADCQGLCPECGRKRVDCVCKSAQGVDTPTDARLSVLKSLLN